jgi:ATP-dependent DNA helicase RecG
MTKFVDQILNKLAELIQQDRFEELETDALEIKPVPADGAQWKEFHKSVNAFLNTRGGIIILGIKESVAAAGRRYFHMGWQGHAEPKLKDIATLFTDRKGVVQDLSDRVAQIEIRPFLAGSVAVFFVDELAADRKYVFLKGKAFKRILTSDHEISESEIEAQEAFKEEALLARELRQIQGLTVADLDLTKLNEFIFRLNQPVLIETMKSDMAQAIPFLERRLFLKDGVVTVLGALVCAKYPGDCLGFRSHVHGYVDVARQSNGPELGSQIVQDKQDFVDNVVQLMEAGIGYFLRNIQVGVSARNGGTSQPQYPESLLRETINNALAHRDYAIDRQIILAIKPGRHISVQNPGTFRKPLLIEAPNDAIPLRRILPEAKPRNPKLADVLRVYRKWEGRGIGMATLVDICLKNQTDLPYYILLSEEVRLHLCAGKLLDERMERLFRSFDGHIENRLLGNSLNEEQKLVLSYLIKSEWANAAVRYTILLSPDNNHFSALAGLEKSGLIAKHPRSPDLYPIYVVDRVLIARQYTEQLRKLFGPSFDSLAELPKQLLGVVYRFNNYSKAVSVTAKQASFSLWYEEENGSDEIEPFDAYYRKVRRAFHNLEKNDFVRKAEQTKRYLLNNEHLRQHPV